MKPGDTAEKLRNKIELIVKSFARSPSSPLSQEQYVKNLDELLSETLKYAYDQGYNNGSKDRGREDTVVTSRDFDNYYLGTGSNRYSRMRLEAINSHSKLSGRNYDFQNSYKEILRIDLKEKQRYLFFRILTAIGIAAVVLATAYIANKYSIPLPLSGIRQVAAAG
jgi:hypothetical protein